MTVLPAAGREGQRDRRQPGRKDAPSSGLQVGVGQPSGPICPAAEQLEYTRPPEILVINWNIFSRGITGSDTVPTQRKTQKFI